MFDTIFVYVKNKIEIKMLLWYILTQIILNMLNFIIDTLDKCKYVVGTILILSSLHWGLIYLYSSICINISLWGFITNIIYMGSPMCFMINEVQYALSNHYVTIMASTAVSIITWITLNAPFKRNRPEQHEHGD